VLTAIDGATSRAQVLRRLLEADEVAGATGAARFDARGDLTTPLLPMTIDASGEAIPLEDTSAPDE
jgi:hypothetical protein